MQFSPREPRDISTETQCVALTSQAALNEAAPVPTWSEIEEQAREGPQKRSEDQMNIMKITVAAAVLMLVVGVASAQAGDVKDGAEKMTDGAAQGTVGAAKGAGDIGKSAVGGTVGVAKGAGKGAVKAGQNVVEGTADIVGGAADMTKGAVGGLVGGGN